MTGPSWCAAHGVAAQARDPGATAAAELGPLPIICASFGAAGEGFGWRVSLRAGLLLGCSGPTARAGRAGSLRGLDRAPTARNHTARARPVECSGGAPFSFTFQLSIIPLSSSS